MDKERQIEEMATIIARNVYGIDEPDVDYLPSARKAAEESFDVGYRKQEWISVDERLPEREGKYIAYTTRGTIEIARFYSYYVNDKPQFDYWITHWMPLPEAPEMKGESDG